MFLNSMGRGVYILKFNDYLDLTGDVFDKYVIEEKSSYGGKSYSRPWDKEAYTVSQRKIIEDKRKAKEWKPGL